jgi:NDP-sugar pyrophosphorylase family protein
MRAIILAAGKGERIKEVTKSIPKPMIRIHGKPILEHNIEWLRSYGITDLYINLHHLPDVITNYFGNGEKHRVRITYSYEPELLGTAGAVKKICREIWRFKDKKENMDPFLVIYGDNLMMFDLNEIINFHYKKGGIATIAVYEKEDVWQSGIVLLNDKGQVLRFIEKPSSQEVISNLVNAGIYVLEFEVLNYIPDNQNIDFGKDVFPSIINSGEKLFAIKVEGDLIAIDTPELLRKYIS